MVQSYLLLLLFSVFLSVAAAAGELFITTLLVSSPELLLLSSPLSSIFTLHSLLLSSKEASVFVLHLFTIDHTFGLMVTITGRGTHSWEKLFRVFSIAGQMVSHSHQMKI